MKRVSLHTQAYAPKRYTAGFGMVAITRTQSIHIVKYENLDIQLERIELVGGGGGMGGRGSKHHQKRAIMDPQANRHLNGVSLAGQ